MTSPRARRGEPARARETGRIDDYAAGLRKVGIRDVTSATIPEAGHFTPDEAPEALWAALVGFIER